MEATARSMSKGQRTQGVALEDTWFLKMDEDLDKAGLGQEEKSRLCAPTR